MDHQARLSGAKVLFQTVDRHNLEIIEANGLPRPT